MSPGDAAPGPRWLLLIHQIPPKPDYLRVKIGRRLQRVGAVAVKNSVYVLPEGDQPLEDFQWIRTEIIGGGGGASICRAEFVDGLTNDQIRELFRNARGADYTEIATAAGDLLAAARLAGQQVPKVRTRPDDELSRLRTRFAMVAAIDFFDAPERTAARDSLDLLEAELQPERPAQDSGSPPRLNQGAYRGRTWVTRENVFVDRMASAWLIRRFIDRDAVFKFVREEAHQPARDELRFDMFEGEFTHEGDRCTFEVLVAWLAIDDPALRSLAEIVHDIDLKDGKFGRDEGRGIERVLAAIARFHGDDAARVERAHQMFDELYELSAAETSAMSKGTGSTAAVDE
jgi:hypothetical protein